MDLSTQTSSPFNCILFDLDDTLYSGGIGIPRYMRRNIEDFLSKTCGISSSDACALRAEFFRTFGSSFIGLRARGYDVHPDVYHSFVHGKLPYDLITPEACLRDTLRSIPQTKILFTNSDRQHAKKVLERLGIEEKMFARIICFETMNPHLFSPAADAVSLPSKPVVLKPSTTAMEVAIKIAGFDPRCMLFLDDNEKNIAAGKALGLNTVLVGKTVKSKEADYVLESIGDLRETVPEIWRREAEAEAVDQEKKGLGSIVGVHDAAHRNEVDFSGPATFVEPCW